MLVSLVGLSTALTACVLLLVSGLKGPVGSLLVLELCWVIMFCCVGVAAVVCGAVTQLFVTLVLTCVSAAEVAVFVALLVA